MDPLPPHDSLNRHLFSTCWLGTGARDDDAFEMLQHCYAEGHRAYHTAEHIAECLGWWERLRPLAERPLELGVAIYFHDAVYQSLGTDNEGRSAALLSELARPAGLGEPVIGRVRTLIESTRAHEAMDGDAALLSDIDLSVLGASPARYARYERAVRCEYAAVDEAAFRAGRGRVLGDFLSRWAIYRTEPMASLLERQARINLTWALDALAEPRRTACSSL